jgi:hypothetical protein
LVITSASQPRPLAAFLFRDRRHPHPYRDATRGRFRFPSSCALVRLVDQPHDWAQIVHANRGRRASLPMLERIAQCGENRRGSVGAWEGLVAPGGGELHDPVLRAVACPPLAQGNPTAAAYAPRELDDDHSFAPGSSPSTSVVPLSNQVTTLNHKRFKGFKMFSDGHSGLLDTALRHCNEIQAVIDDLAAKGAHTELRLLVNRLQRLAFRSTPNTPGA